MICADANEPGLLCAFIDEKLSARIAGSIAEIDRAHGHERFRGNDGKPVSWAVSIKTPLKDALINRFEVIDDISAYDQWIAALEEAAAFLRSEKAQFENEIATATCSGCGHALAAHLHTRSAELDCHAIGGMPIGGSERKLGKFRKGQMAVVMTLVIATLVGVMSLGADVGVMYYNWVQLQKGADAAAVAGASYLNEGAAGLTLAAADVNANCTGQSDDAKKAACTYAINNGLATDANSLTINEPGQNLPAGRRPLTFRLSPPEIISRMCLAGRLAFRPTRWRQWLRRLKRRPAADISSLSVCNAPQAGALFLVPIHSGSIKI